MKLVIGRNVKIDVPGTRLERFFTDNLFPEEIREDVYASIKLAEDEKDSEGIETYLQTMNMTVMDLIQSSDSKNFDPKQNIAYEDVFIWRGGKLIPLLELRDEAWLSHFNISELFNRGEL